MKKVKRPWGWYRVLSHNTDTGYKIKELDLKIIDNTIIKNMKIILEVILNIRMKIN